MTDPDDWSHYFPFPSDSDFDVELLSVDVGDGKTVANDGPLLAIWLHVPLASLKGTITVEYRQEGGGNRIERRSDPSDDPDAPPPEVEVDEDARITSYPGMRRRALECTFMTASLEYMSDDKVEFKVQEPQSATLDFIKR